MNKRTFLKTLASLPVLLVNPYISRSDAKTRSITMLKTLVAGFQYYQGKSIRRSLKTGQELKLKREPRNPYDEKAIEIYWKTKKLGYIPRVDNEVVTNLMIQGKDIRAFILNKNESDDPWERIGVRLDLLC
ncbi:MAG: HIRAN domain-containing protein [Thermodesulfobacteriota bacterium]|nr:HIRAN domain-containing protein [Thermodesulfobacteriota bacterium]